MLLPIPILGSWAVCPPPRPSQPGLSGALCPALWARGAVFALPRPLPVPLVPQGAAPDSPGLAPVPSEVSHGATKGVSGPNNTPGVAFPPLQAPPFPSAAAEGQGKGRCPSQKGAFPGVTRSLWLLASELRSAEGQRGQVWDGAGAGRGLGCSPKASRRRESGFILG